MRTIVAVAFAFSLSGECAAAEYAVTFEGSGGIPLAGSLMLPTAAAPGGTPAILLLQGSGPTDRDGNQRPALVTDLERQVAELLASEGVASLRYDKRGMHENRSTMPADAKDLPSFFAWSAFVDDARAALRFLSAQPGIDDRRVGVLGHSEGGLFAVALSASESPRILVLASTPARPLGEVIHDQIARHLDRQGATEAQRAFFLDADLRVQSHIRATGLVPADVPAGIAAFYPSYLGPYLRSALEFDPGSMVKRLRIPTLAIYGGADAQVSAERDAPLMASALDRRSDGSRNVVVPGVSHNLKKVASAEDPGFAGPLDEAVKREVVTFLRNALQR
ncbi:MAG: alpha/beta hydrolase family protein [Gemmatimonas sp.]